MTTTDVMMLGWLSPEALAAGALGYNLYMPLFLFCIGVVGARRADRGEPGRRRPRATPRACAARAIRRCSAPSLLAGAAGLGAAVERRGHSARDRRAAGPRGAAPALYMHGLQWALAPALLYFATRSLFAALDRTGADPDRRPDRGRLQRRRQLRADLRPFRRAGLGRVRLGPRDQPVAVRSCCCCWSAIRSSIRTCAAIGCSPASGRASMAEPSPQLWRLGLPIGATIAAEISIFAAAGAGDGADRPRLRSRRTRSCCRSPRPRSWFRSASARPRACASATPSARATRARSRARAGPRSSSPWPMSRSPRRRCSPFPRLLISPFLATEARRPTPRSSRWRCRSCASPRFSRCSTARRRRSPTCCAASTTRAGRW